MTNSSVELSILKQSPIVSIKLDDNIRENLASMVRVCRVSDNNGCVTIYFGYSSHKTDVVIDTEVYRKYNTIPGVHINPVRPPEFHGPLIWVLREGGNINPEHMSVEVYGTSWDDPKNSG